jgi:cell shape-determining protein MreC
MSVMSASGLVGKVTRVFSSRSIVMLISDPQFAVSVKVIGQSVIPGSSKDPTVPSTTTTLPPTTTVPAVPGTELGGLPTGDTVLPGETAGSGEIPAGTEIDPATGLAVSTTTTVVAPAATTTTTIPLADLANRELGALEGRGTGQTPVVTLIQADRRALEIRAGDVVATSGGCQSLAPPDLVIGRVSNVVDRAGSAGPLVEVEPQSDLSDLNFLVVVLYRPQAEQPGACELG